MLLRVVPDGECVYCLLEFYTSFMLPTFIARCQRGRSLAKSDSALGPLYPMTAHSVSSNGGRVKGKLRYLTDTCKGGY